MRTFKDIIEPIKGKMTCVGNEYRLVVRTDDRMIYAIPEDQEMGEIITMIIGEIDKMKPKIEVLCGSRNDHGIPTFTYLDRDGSVIDVVRDGENKRVILSYRRRK